MNKTAAVTTPRDRDDLDAKAAETARELGVEFIPREFRSFAKMFDEFGCSGIWVVTDGRPVVQTRAGAISYHEGSSVLRTHKRNTAPDAVVRAMRLEPDFKVLDATLGMAVDSLVIASSLGDDGRVTGLESGVLLHGLVKDGLANYEFKTSLLARAASRITPVLAEHVEFLNNCGPGEFDVVYFDPMFDKPVAESTMMRRIREIAEDRPLTMEVLELAKRAARRRVVVKGRRGCFSEIEFDEFIPSGGSVFYGIIEIEKND